MVDLNNWSVYKHTLPDGKVYIGITSKSPSERWDNGFGYETQRKFFKQIVKYGWDNISHEVIASELDEKSARETEQSLINELMNKEARKCLNTSGTGDVNKAKRGFAGSHFREESNPIVRSVKLSGRLDDIWLENYHHFFECYPHHSEVHDDAVYLYWYFNMESPDIYKIPLPEYVITYGELWEYLNRGASGEFVNKSKEVC